MRQCDKCRQWAQWRGTVKDGVKLIAVWYLCQTHKDADKTPNMTFTFMGAVPKEL